MVVFIHSGHISALVGGEGALSVNWPGRLECNLDYGEGRLDTGSGYPLIGKGRVAEEEGELGPSKS